MSEPVAEPAPSAETWWCSWCGDLDAPFVRTTDNVDATNSAWSLCASCVAVRAEEDAAVNSLPEEFVVLSSAAVAGAKSSHPRITVLSLFDGVSCARVALERAGYADVEYHAAEIDNYAKKVVRERWPETRQLGDVRKVEKMDGLFLLIGGSPCQDLSVAKLGRKGLDGERSSLFFEYMRLKQECKPRFFILENVESMTDESRDAISMHMGVAPIMIDAGLVSAQHRKRYFWTNIPVVGLPEDRHLVLADILEKEADAVFDITRPFTPMPNKMPTSSGLVRAGWLGKPKEGMTGEKAHDWSYSNIVYLPSGKSQTITRGGCFYIKDGERVRRLTPLECERLQGLPDNYTATKLANTHRYAALGNAFNVDVICFLLSFIP